MFYQEYLPHPVLSEFIHCYWVLEHLGNGQQTVETVIPDGKTEMILNYGTPFTEITTPGKAQQSRFFFYGQIDQALTLEPSQQVGMLGIRFHSYGLYPLIGIPVAQLNNHRVVLEDLLTEGSVLAQQFSSCTTTKERLSLIDHFMLSAFAGKTVDPAVKYLMQLVNQQPGEQSLYDGYQQMGFSKRHLRRKFQLWTGWTPQQMNTVARLQKLLGQWKCKNFCNLTDLALSCGYYDQSHFIRDFRKFAGVAPSVYFTKEDPLANNFF